jgi:hypothetical protein
MNITVTIPDEYADLLVTGTGDDLQREALEALVAKAYRAGRLTRPDLRRLLGFQTSHEIDGFLKSHDIYDSITLDELNRQLETLDRLGL